MPAPSIATEAIALKISPAGEKFSRLHLLTPGRGLLLVLRRANSKKPASSIDLYEQGEAQVELKPDGSFGFLKDFVAVKRRRALGRSYAALEAAARLSRFFLANPMHEENWADVFALADKALDALDAGHSSDAALLKTFFVYSRKEGYPVAEEWVPALNPSMRESVTAILNTPLSELPASDSKHAQALAALVAYLERRTHIHLA